MIMSQDKKKFWKKTQTVDGHEMVSIFAKENDDMNPLF